MRAFHRPQTPRLLLLCILTVYGALDLLPGDKRCQFQQLDARSLTEPIHLEKPTLLKNAFAWQPHFGLQSFVRSVLGHFTFKFTKDLEHLVSSGVPPSPLYNRLDHFLDTSLNGTGKSPHYLFDWCLGSCIRELSSHVPLPSTLLEDYMGKAFVSVGKGGGLPEHTHGTSWAAQLSGQKQWETPSKNPGVEIPTTISRWKCTQNEGEIVLIPEQWPHGTSALEWQASFGVQQLEQFSFMDLEKEAGGTSVHKQIMVQMQFGNMSSLSEEVINKHRKMKEHYTDMALVNGHMPVLEMILGAKAKMVDFLDYVSTTAEQGQFEMARSLIQKAKEKNKGKVGPKMLRILEEAVDVAVKSGSEKTLGVLEEAGVDLCLKKHSEMFPLHAAVTNGHYAIVKSMLNKRCSPERRNAEHKTALEVQKEIASRPRRKKSSVVTAIGKLLTEAMAALKEAKRANKGKDKKENLNNEL